MFLFNAAMMAGSIVMFAFGVATAIGIAPIYLIIAAIAALAAIVYVLMANWEPITAFFSGLWDKITAIFRGPIDAIKSMMSGLFGGFSDVLGGTMAINQDVAMTDSTTATGIGSPGSVVTSNEQMMQTMAGFGTGEIVINDSSGKAAIAKQPTGGMNMVMRNSGGF